MITVKDLKEMLKGFDEDLVVMVKDDRGEYTSFSDAYDDEEMVYDWAEGEEVLKKTLRLWG